MDMFGRRFPKRTYDVGIAEQHAVTFAAGMAVEGLKPFCCVYSTFMQRAYDQVRFLLLCLLPDAALSCGERWKARKQEGESGRRSPARFDGFTLGCFETGA